MDESKLKALAERVRSRKTLGDPGDRRATRLQAGESLGSLAAVIGVSKMSVRSWELGESAPRGDHAVAYAQVLQTLREVSGS
jgi:DNA-binding transcriptional regulator YiaG